MQAQVNGTELFYTAVGEGTPLLFMHGGLGFDHTYFRPWNDRLTERGIQCIYYDHRGNGRSARPANWEDITHDTWANDADALRETLGHDKIVLLGHSYGGFLAQEYALRHQDHLAGLIISCSAPALDYPDIILENAQRRGTPEQVEAFAAGLGNPTDDDDEMRALIGHIISFYFKRYDPAICAEIDRQTRYSGPAFRHSFTQCIPNFNVEPRLSEIQVPTLILSGRDDWITPPEQGERIQTGIPGSELVIFEESGHFPFIEETEKYLDVVTGFVRRVM
jgi:proline iminopeptidase